MARILTKKPDEKPLRLSRSRGWEAGQVMVMQALTDKDVASVKALRSEGLSDTRIWRALRPEDRNDVPVEACEKTGQFCLKLEELTKAQLITLLEASLKEPMGSLEKLSREDLIRLIRNFRSPARGRITLTP